MTDNNPTTRRQIITMLRRRGGMNANDIARELGITDIAVRRHLNTLERDRMVEVETVRQAMGRPTFVYSLTEDAEEFFPKNYADITLEILQDIGELQGEELINTIFERREHRLEKRFNSRIGDKPLEARVMELARIQDERGYMTEWEKDDAQDQIFFTEHNCPIHSVAQQYQQACDTELSLFRKVLDADVEQLECKAKGGQRCIYSVKPKK